MKFLKVLGLFFLSAAIVWGIGQEEGSHLFDDSLSANIQSELAHFHTIEHSNKTIEKITALKNIGASYHRINAFDSAVHYYDLGARWAFENKKSELFSSLKYNLSLVYLKQGMYREALEAALIALETDKTLKNTDNIASSLNSVALIYQEWGIYDKALEYRLQSIQMSEDANNPVELANGHFNLGSLYVKIGKPDQAMTYFLQAQAKYQSLVQENPSDSQLKQGVSESIYSIGGIYLYQEAYQKALELFNQALDIKNGLADKVGIGNCYHQIGLIHFLQNEFEQARQNYFLALQYKNGVNDQKGIALVYYRIGDLYYHWTKYAQSETFLQKSSAVAKRMGDHEILQADYELLYQISSNQKNYKEALVYHELYKAYSDSSSNEKVTNVVEELSVRYETEKKEKENKILTGENKIKALTIQKQKSMGLYLIAMIALAVVIVIVLYVLYRSKRRTNTLISYKNALLAEQNGRIAVQKKEIEKKNQRLTDSIQYAKRIQRAMLADVKQLNSALDDAFIYFRPKDMVSGDFYWLGQVDQKLVIAAIDCTGHGVPGALMSMLGNSFLNQIILNQKTTAPDRILEELSNEVKFALKQEETHNRDGMDMALCTIDLQTKEVEFAGAKNPLIVIRNGKAERIKGDKKPIGFSHYPGTTFQKHQIDIGTPTCLYMFSDGYIDQFGGEKGRKFMIKRFQSLLEEIHTKPMEEQHEILNTTMNEWMKSEDQIDDILIVGLKIGS